MSKICKKCGKEYEDDFRDDSFSLCPDCAKPSNHGDSTVSDSMYVVCAFCKKHFYVKERNHTQNTYCEFCGKAIDLDTNNTILMEDATDSDIFIDDNINNNNIFKLKHNDTSIDESKRIGGYNIGKVLSESLLGTVYEGEQVNLRRKVSLYVLSEKHSTDSSLVDTFMIEARKSASLVHPNICRVFDVGIDNGRNFLVSEFVKGISLEDRIKQAQLLTVYEAASFGAQAARTLSDAEEKAKLLHYGLFPGNIIDCGNGKIRLMFFGINHTIFPENKILVSIDEAVAIFYSPEQLAGKKIDHRSDLYSLGVSLYCGLTGTLPYNVSEIKQVIDGKGIPKVPNLKSMREDVPEQLISIIESLIQINPTDRPSNGAEVAVLFEAFSQVTKNTNIASKATIVSDNRDISPERKRKYKRFPIDMTVSITSSDIDKDKQKAYIERLKDIGENGAFILAKNPLPIGSFVNLDFKIEETGVRVSVLGVVRWCDMSKEQKGMGVQFLEVSNKAKKDLPKIINRKTAQATAAHLISSAIHKKILRFVVMHYGDEVTFAEMMRGLGTSRKLFERALSDFEGVGVVEINGEKILCSIPTSDELRNAIEAAVNIY